MQSKGNSYSLSSDCPYHYSKMVYAWAMVPSKKTPCTNVPLDCPLCPSGRDGRKQTFWKYNFIHHITSNHLTDAGELPPFPPELRISCHISKLEELALGVQGERTRAWRDENKIPDSDVIDKLREELVRKRAASDVSQSSTGSSWRQPSPTKRGRVGL